MFFPKVYNGSNRTSCEISSKLAIKIPKRRLWRRFDVIIVNYEHILCSVLVFLLLTLNKYMPVGFDAITAF